MKAASASPTGETTAGPAHAPVRHPGWACWHGAPECGADALTIAAPECVGVQACEVDVTAKAVAGASRSVTTASSAAIARVLVSHSGLVIRLVVAS